MAVSISRRRCLAILSAAVPGAFLAGRLPASARASDLAPTLRRGINIHNALNWPQVEKGDGPTRYVWPPFREATNPVTDEEFRRLKAMGFDFIRVTVDPSIFIVTEGPRRDELMEIALGLVRRMHGFGFNVVFDLHPVAVNPDYAPRRLMEPGSPAFAAYADMVEWVAARLDALPHDRIVFELMNEPLIEPMSQIGRWQPMLEELHARARKGAPHLPLMLSGAMWSSLAAMLALDVSPFRGSNVFYTFHYYDPHTFTHQGVRGDDAQYLASVPWPMTSDAAAPLLEAAARRAEASAATTGIDAAKATARTKQLVDVLLLKEHNAGQIEADMASVGHWTRANGVSADRILLGEFGCVASSHGIALGPDRNRWIAAVRSAAEGEGLSWAYWAYKGWGGMEMVSWEGQLDPTVIEPLGLSPPA